MVGEHSDFQAGTRTLREAERGGYQTRHNQGACMCLLLFYALVTLDQLQLCPEMAEPLIFPCHRADSRGITGSCAAATASKAPTSPQAVERK